jgi:glycosyltransferase involved in cell wall biosynthesis
MGSRISLSMIARDEAALIGDCIASAKGAVDDVVVVDTGSEDGTPDLARRAGAKVVDFRWQNDFAAARNASLAAATGDWVLVLDADERLAPGAAATIRAAVRASRSPAGLLRLHDAASLSASPADVVSGRARLGEPNELPRLFRRDPDLAYEGVVHEHVGRWLQRHAVTYMSVDADIVHLGAVPELREARGKRGRNVALLRRRWREDPLDFDAAGYLAQELYGADAFDEAWDVVEDAWSRRSEASRFGTYKLCVARALVGLKLRKPDDALAALAEAEGAGTRHPELAFLRGCALLQKAWAAAPGSEALRAALHGAEAATREALAPHGDRIRDSIRGARSWLAHTQLGTALLLLDRAAEARAQFEAALRDQPAYEDAALGLAEVDLSEGRPLPALRRLEPLLGEVRDAWWLAACAADALGSRADAELFFSRALSDPSGFRAWHRAQAVAATAARRGGR